MPETLKKSIPTGDGDPVYRHSGGWLIVRQTRSWSERVGAMRGHGEAGPKTYWVVIQSRYEHFTQEVYESHHIFRTLREARSWCDSQ